MRFLRWNSFTIIGVILLAIGVYGLIKGVAFQFDAGLPNENREAIYYLLVGILMVVNGYIAPAPVSDAKTGEPAVGDGKSPAPSSSRSGAPVETK